MSIYVSEREGRVGGMDACIKIYFRILKLKIHAIEAELLNISWRVLGLEQLLLLELVSFLSNKRPGGRPLGTENVYFGYKLYKFD